MASKVDNRSNWSFKSYLGNLDLPNKQELAEMYARDMFNRTVQIFDYDNLPPTIKKRDLELLIQTRGYGVCLKHEGNVYILQGALGGLLNEQYLPTLAIVTNPYLKLSEQYKIDEECVVIKNDSTYTGLLPITRKYSSLLAECDLSIKYSAFNVRILNLITADNENTAKSAQKILDDIMEGEKLGIILSNPMYESVKTYPFQGSAKNYITELNELHQNLIANWFIDLGLNANFNLKRETLTSTEVGVNEFTLYPRIDDMLYCREEAIEKINKMFNLNIKVKFNSSWKIAYDDLMLQNEEFKNEVEQLKIENENLKTENELLINSPKENDNDNESN